MIITENPAVEISSLTVAYDSKPVLSNVDLELPRGMLTAVMGPNGAGKTTLIKAMLGLIPTLSGSIIFPDINGKKPCIGYVPQSESLDRDFPVSVLDVVTMGCYGRLGWIKRPAKQDKELAMEMLKKTGMADYAHRQIGQLSGGQQQRAFIARALAQKADIYLMDEPFKGVDAATEKAIIELLKELRSSGKTVVAVHHDLSTVSDYFDWVTLINMKVVANGEVKKVFTDENLNLTYRSVKAGGAV
ncbi:MAG: metal ABC transporter ATP-binding protein [Firmicutes bacterium]|nr:metal ABC transporter ATP-binding protein [[Eubacterium] siraeum]MCM1487686.1 metal ABC transporter ATP-binding protein [Bacillota bacterium]